jgi:hypothetical protein
MTDPLGGDRSTDPASDVEDVLPADRESVESDAERPDVQPARVDSGVGLLDRADPDGSA